MRRRLRAAAAAALAAWVAALGCAGAPHAPRSEPQPSPLLWRAEAPGAGGATLYLLGSVHLGTRRAHDLGRRIERAWDESEELVVELDLTQTTPVEMVRLTHALGTLPPDRRLADVLSPESHALLAEYLTERELPMDSIERLEPWVVTITLTVIELQAAGYETEFGVDQLFLAQANGRKPIVALETVESQLSALDSLPLAIQELMLLDVLARGDRFQEETVDLVAAWERGDEAALGEIVFSPEDEYPELEAFYEKVFFERNEAMCERLRALAADGRTRFVIVGVGHMLGPRGIPALLASHGYRVERIAGGGEPGS